MEAAAVKLLVFHSKIENQVILCRTYMCVSSRDMLLIGIFPNNDQNIQFIQLNCVTNVFISTKPVVMFPCFHIHWIWLSQTSLFFFVEFLRAERVWKLLFIRILNNIKFTLRILTNHLSLFSRSRKPGISAIFLDGAGKYNYKKERSWILQIFLINQFFTKIVKQNLPL